jgi:hypothetical protein
MENLEHLNDLRHLGHSVFFLMACPMEKQALEK